MQLHSSEHEPELKVAAAEHAVPGERRTGVHAILWVLVREAERRREAPLSHVHWASKREMSNTSSSID